MDDFFGVHVAQRRVCMYVLAEPLFITGLPRLGRVLQDIVTHYQLPLQLAPPHDDEGSIISAAVDHSHIFPHIPRLDLSTAVLKS